MKNEDKSVRLLTYLYILIGILALLVLGLYAMSIGMMRKSEAALPVSADTELQAVEEQTVQEAEPEYPPEKVKPSTELSAADIMSGYRLISHGLGNIEGVDTANCLEGMQQNYAGGIRLFEIDIRLTSDGKLILRHDWRGKMQEGVDELNIPTYEEFLSKPVFEDYTALSFKDILIVMEQYPDICIITDTKFVDEEVITYEFKLMLQEAKELGLTYLFDRMVIQVYSEKMYKVIQNLYPFKYCIYTVYNEGFACTDAAFEERAGYCEKYNLLGIVMPDYWWDKRYIKIAKEYGINVWVHTIDDAKTAKQMFKDGVKGVFTDLLVQSDLK